MAILEKMIEFSSSFPSIAIKGRLLSILLDYGCDPGKYAAASLTISFFASVLALVLLLVFYPPFVLSGFFLTVAFSFAFLLFLPEAEHKRRVAKMEAELPFLLRTIGMLMKVGIPFERALRETSKEEGELHHELRVSLGEKSKGLAMEKALSHMAISMRSLHAKRAISQLISAYKVGGSGKELVRIGDELLAIGQHKERQYASKSAIFGLLFIVSSAVLPTFFLVYSIIGRVGGEPISRETIFAALIILFPLINIIILLFSHALAPPSPFHREKRIDPVLLLPFPASIIIFLVLPQPFLLPAVFAGGLVILAAFFKTFEKERRAEETEAHLPDALLLLSSLPKSVNTASLFMTVENAGYGALSEETGISRRQVENGLKFEHVLEDLKKRGNSPMLARAVGMLKHLFEVNSLDRLNVVADDVLRYFEIRRERSRLMSMQKYTLIFGGVLIPVILRLALNMLAGMESFFGESEIANLVQVAESLIPPYLIIYSAMCSVYVGDIEGKKSSTVIYFAAISIISLSFFILLPLLL